MNETDRPKLQLIPGDREALERQLVYLCLYGTTDEFRIACEALAPRGQLTLVVTSNTAPPDDKP
ncbi:hypothetical protein ABQJ54_18770 [Rhodanobacter sp. Si-c]|uniref:Uncharacterized protein n=1 Tax=Rhodanobacter lycopersici TaxID=3162487 RepID=A0ABV3QJD9_9GAMM